MVLSTSDNLIPFSAGLKRQVGQGGSTAHAAPTFLSPFQKHYLLTSRTAVSFKQWSEVECQKCLPGGLLIEHVKFNLNISDFITTDNVLVLLTEYMFLEQV